MQINTDDKFRQLQNTTASCHYFLKVMILYSESKSLIMSNHCTL